MSEAVKVENLFRGLHPNLLKKVYPMKPKTSAEFLAAVKLHSEAGEMAGQRKLELGMAYDRMDPTKLVLELQSEVQQLQDDLSDPYDDSDDSNDQY